MQLAKLAFVLLLLSSGMAFLCCHKSESFRFQVAFPDTQGVKKDTNVFYRGIQVGRVERIYLQSASTDRDTEVLINIVLTNPTAKVREKDIIRATAFGFLGDRVIDIVPGASSSPLVASGSKLRGEIQPSLQEVSAFLKELTEVAPKFSCHNRKRTSCSRHSALWSTGKPKT